MLKKGVDKRKKKCLKRVELGGCVSTINSKPTNSALIYLLLFLKTFTIFPSSSIASSIPSPVVAQVP